LKQALIHASMVNHMISNMLTETIKNNNKYANPNHLIHHGYRIYSQSDEDGLINEIFNRIGTTNKEFVEIGVGDGLENNTLGLLVQNWRGVWIDSSGRNIKKIHRGMKYLIDNNHLVVIQKFVTKENINDILTTTVHNNEIDLLSVDIDGNDYYIVEAITCLSPRVIIIEYNAKFPPPLHYCMKYDPFHKWRGDDHFGASLKFLEHKFSQMNYSLVGCSISGVNAFFVRNDLLSNKFDKPYTAEIHFEPRRYFLVNNKKEYRVSYKTIEEIVRDQVKE